MFIGQFNIGKQKTGEYDGNDDVIDGYYPNSLFHFLLSRCFFFDCFLLGCSHCSLFIRCALQTLQIAFLFYAFSVSLLRFYMTLLYFGRFSSFLSLCIYYECSFSGASLALCLFPLVCIIFFFYSLRVVCFIFFFFSF